MFELRKSHFLVQGGKKKKKKEVLLGTLVEVKAVYIKTYFSSEQRRQNLRILGRKH